MPEILWRLPAAAERSGALRPFRSQVRDERAGRFTYLDHVAPVARAAEVTGFAGVVVPDDPDGDDHSITGVALARRAHGGLLVVVELDDAVANAVYLAKMAMTFQRCTGDALGWRFDRRAAGPATDPTAADPTVADPTAVDPTAVERLDELLTVARGVWAGPPFSFAGRHQTVQDGGFSPPLAGRPFPVVQVVGEDPAVVALSARLADVHLWSGPAGTGAPASGRLAAAVGALDALAATHGRTVRHAVERHVVARDTHDEAALAAVGAPAGAIVGSYERVAAELDALVDAGIDQLVLSGAPSLEETYRVGAQVLPRLAAAHRPVPTGTPGR